MRGMAFLGFLARGFLRPGEAEEEHFTTITTMITYHDDTSLARAAAICELQNLKLIFLLQRLRLWVLLSVSNRKILRTEVFYSTHPVFTLILQNYLPFQPGWSRFWQAVRVLLLVPQNQLYFSSHDCADCHACHVCDLCAFVHSSGVLLDITFYL